MRIHRLEISAFGPFAATERIDFDRLSAHGLFLLNGPTGAGKTSVLDAICYALYGSVPGARGAVEQEQAMGAEPVEIDVFGCGEGPEGGDLETMDPHSETPSRRTDSRASVRTAASRSSAARPRTCSRKPQQTERSSSASASRLL